MKTQNNGTTSLLRKDWETSPKADAIKKVIAAYHTDDVKKVIEESSDGLDQPVW